MDDLPELGLKDIEMALRLIRLEDKIDLLSHHFKDMVWIQKEEYEQLRLIIELMKRHDFDA